LAKVDEGAAYPLDSAFSGGDFDGGLRTLAFSSRLGIVPS